MNTAILKPKTFSNILSHLMALCVFFTPLYACAKSTGAGASVLIEADNLQLVAKEMREKNLPLLIEFHAESCPYCSLLEEDFLAPIAKSSEYKDKILIRKVQIDIDLEIIDFQGKEIPASQFAARYKAFMTPTMIFVDANGREAAEKIVGINTPSLFGAYLDAEIEKALNNVRAKSPSQ